MVVECWRLKISGRVQGVYFRASSRDKAQSLGLTRWVRNRSIGQVEIMAEGDLDQLQSLYDWCKEGPPDADVENVQREVENASGQFPDFEVATDV